MFISAIQEGGTETRVSITPNHIQKFINLGLDVLIEKNAGFKAGFSDKSYELSKAEIVSTRKKTLADTTILATVDIPLPDELTGLKPESLLISSIHPDPGHPLIQWALKNRISLLTPNLIPRISRSQSMDVLTSQANIAGYRAVIEGVRLYHRAVPMMMTAAGMIKPAKVLVLGAGVAGLQAVATAKRLGAEVSVFDVRPSVKEQVESLGATFVEVDHEELEEQYSGYAGEMSNEYKNKQAGLIDQQARISDIIITTALIPGKPAPLLLTKDTINQMKNGSVIIDLAASRGGNCELSEPDEIIKHKQITIFGICDAARLVPATASELFCNNIANLLKLLISTDGQLLFDDSDEIIKQALICHEGQYMPFQPEEV